MNSKDLMGRQKNAKCSKELKKIWWIQKASLKFKELQIDKRINKIQKISKEGNNLNNSKSLKKSKEFKIIQTTVHVCLVFKII